jgi:hypothetical protein
MANEGQQLDKILSCLAGMASRLDALEARPSDAAKPRRAKADAEKGKSYVPPLAGDRDDPDRKIDEPRRVAADNEGIKPMSDDDLPEKIRRAKALRDQLRALESEVNREMRQQGPLCESEESAMADAQARADSVYGALGKRAPGPLPGERLAQYRVRLLKPLKSHSKTWSDVDLSAQSGSKNMDLIERQILDDAQVFADSAESYQGDGLQAVSKQDPDTGHRVTTFKGRRSFINQFRDEARLARIVDPREIRLRELLQREQV